MPTKKGAGGHQQRYDHKGRYCKNVDISYPKQILTKKEKARKRAELQLEILYNQACKSRDKYLFDVFLEIENSFPHYVTAVNAKKRDDLNGKLREFDIICKNCIIEVKSGSVSGKERQFLDQKDFAVRNRKQFFVYAPDINKMRTYEYSKAGIDISTTKQELLSKLREINK